MLLDFKEWVNRGNVYYVKSPSGLEVPFVATRSNLVVVVVNPRKLDASFALSSNFYVGSQGAGGIEGRYTNFQQWLQDNQGKPIQMSCAQFTSPPQIRKRYAGEAIAWQVDFDDGRHRFAWFRDQGFGELPIQVPKRDAMDFQQKFGG